MHVLYKRVSHLHTTFFIIFLMLTNNIVNIYIYNINLKGKILLYERDVNVMINHKKNTWWERS